MVPVSYRTVFGILRPVLRHGVYCTLTTRDYDRHTITVQSPTCQVCTLAVSRCSLSLTSFHLLSHHYTLIMCDQCLINAWLIPLIWIKSLRVVWTYRYKHFQDGTSETLSDSTQSNEKGECWYVVTDKKKQPSNFGCFKTYSRPKLPADECGSEHLASYRRLRDLSHKGRAQEKQSDIIMKSQI